LASTISGNAIANYVLATNSSGTNFTGIYAYGLCTINANTIGSSTGTGNISIVSEYAGSVTVYGINTAGSSNNYTISNNTIGSFDVGGTLPTHAVSFYGISVTGNTYSILNNLIGSATTANSIIASNNSSNGQSMYGIYSSSYSTNNIINGNTISNLTNVSNSANSTNNINGIFTNSTTITVVGNTIQNLTSASSSAYTGFRKLFCNCF
jgi:hypothetical protein